MSVDKLVDSTQLNADLTSVANAIRAKSGGSSQLAFPAGFVSEIGNIPAGETDVLKKFVDAAEYTGAVVSDYAVTARNGLFNRVKWESACLKNLTVGGWVGSMGSLFSGNSFIQKIVLPSVEGIWQECFRSCTSLTAVDLGPSCTQLGNQQVFGSDAALTIIILRRTSIVSLGNANSFNGTPFKSGGTGGTIYIRKTLYDHLGDGTSDDYQAATNWSTIHGYGTITWAKIEGSRYENAYADGTPIS